METGKETEREEVRMQNTQFKREKVPHSKSFLKGWERELREQQLMTAQIRVRDHDLDEILLQLVAEIGCRLWPKVLQQLARVSEQS
jgi:hypothetical protein